MLDTSFDQAAMTTLPTYHTAAEQIAVLRASAEDAAQRADRDHSPEGHYEKGLAFAYRGAANVIHLGVPEGARQVDPRMAPVITFGESDTLDLIVEMAEHLVGALVRLNGDEDVTVVDVDHEFLTVQPTDRSGEAVGSAYTVAWPNVAALHVY